tara:strand:+ start:904 stop:1158 length:255 start_codon:yes stop_codon:yes gene_type:complete
MAEPQEDSKYKGIPKALYPQVRQQIAERTGALKKAISEQNKMMESAVGDFEAAKSKIQAGIDELQGHLNEAGDDLSYINKQDNK